MTFARDPGPNDPRMGDGMESIDQTIAAISTGSPVEGLPARSILRLSGPRAFEILRRLDPSVSPPDRGIVGIAIPVEEITIEATAYLFSSPRSYTGQDVVEIHLEAPSFVVQSILQRILRDSRPARPGEFTLRAYLNARIDLTQAEAVAQVISAGNRLQLDAAQRMVRGQLSGELHSCADSILSLLSLLEAGMDFSEEPISFLSPDQAVTQAEQIQSRLRHLLDQGIREEELIDLPSVGLAGLPNAGKSSFMNALLGRPRSLVSPIAETTRDVLDAELILPHSRCVLFDCAGLLNDARPGGILGELAQTAAMNALQSASLILFCVDGGKADWTEDFRLYTRFSENPALWVITQGDRWVKAADEIHARFERAFGHRAILTSSRTGLGLDEVRRQLDERLVSMDAGSSGSTRLAVTERHRRALRSALDAVEEAGREIARGADEIAASLLRSAVESIGLGQTAPIDEQLLDRIFSRFCIGK